MDLRGFSAIYFVIILLMIFSTSVAFFLLKSKTYEKSNDETLCEQKGGEWGRYGISPDYTCKIPANDAGKTCSDNSQCTYGCIYVGDYRSKTEGESVTGECAKYEGQDGCSDTVKDGKLKFMTVCYE